MTCEHCRQQLLPFLYDLLEPLEREATAAHLASCPECRVALKASREQLGLLAEAVKEEHADIVFKAPTKATPASSAPTVAMHRPPRPPFLLKRWAAAAAILLALFSAGTIFGWSIWRERSVACDTTQERLAKAKDDLSKSQNELNKKKGQTQQEIRAIQEQIDTLFNDWKKEETKARKVLEEKGAQLIIKGPQVPLAGANNRYEVELRQDKDFAANFAQHQLHIGKEMAKADQTNQAGIMPLQIRAFNSRTQETLFQQKLIIQGNNQAKFELPSNMPIKPGDDIWMEFQTQAADGKLITLTDNLKLVFPEYVTHLATDRSLYRPGETVRFRSLTLERFSLKPAQQKFHLRYRIIGPDNKEYFNKEAASTLVAGPNNEPIKGPHGEELYCLGAGQFTLPANLALGPYTLCVSEVNERFNEEKRTFLVHRLNKELKFHRSSYGPGDQLKMQVRVLPVQSLPIGFRNNIQVNARITIDGVYVWSQDAQTDNEGRCAFECTLPDKIATGAGAVILEINDGGPTEKLVRDIPLVVRDVQVDFYPEGGDLIAGVSNRVYLQARTPANKPADFEGRIVDEKNDEVARVQTVSDAKEPAISQGLGAFTFAPVAKKRYRLVIDSPIGIERTLPLPEAKEQGVVMTVPVSVVENEIGVDLMSVQDRRVLLVGAYCRGRMLDHKLVRAGANQPVSVILRPNPGVGGVYRITVFEAVRLEQEITFRPVAERLIYRKNSERVDVAITSDRAIYQPGDTVELSLQAKNENNAFVPALALVAVVDNGVLKLADQKAARSLPTHFLLTTEVRNPEDLEYADVLLGNHPKAATSLDLLLGCQGWRRFAEQNPQMFQRGQQAVNRQRQVKQPNFLANNEMVTQFPEPEQKQIDKLDQTFVKQAIDKEKELAEMEKQEGGPADLHKAVALKESIVHQADQAVAQANHRLDEIRAFLIQFGLGGALLTLLFLGFYLISVGLRHLSEDGGNARSWLSAGLGLLGILFLISVVGTFALMGEDLIHDFRIEQRIGGFNMGVAVGGEAFPVKDEAPLNLPEQEEIVADEERLAGDVQKLEDNAAAVNKLDVMAQQEKNLPGPEQIRPGFNALVVGGNAQNDFLLQQNDPQEDRKLRQEGNYQALLLRNLGRRVQLPPVHDSCVVREYAHQHKPQPDALGRDLSETIYWHPVLVMADGKAQVKFDLSDSVTRFQVLVHSHTFDGRLGTNRVEITSKLPFRVEPIVPREVSDQDQITIPVAIQNDRPKPGIATLSARAKDSKVMDNPDRTWNLQEKEFKRELFHVKPKMGDGNAVVRIIGKTPECSDAVERQLRVVQDGFPVTGSIGGVLEGGTVEHEITLPEKWIPGSLHVQAHFYPSPLAEMQSALDAMQREPAGSVGQNLSSLFPNAMILQFMKQHPNQANPIFEKRARQALLAAAQKLAAYECVDQADKTNKGGYGGFGGAAAPREALTAHGLLQFHEMARVYRFEPGMLERIEECLLQRRDGQGGLKPSAKNPVVDAWIVWALAESGVKEDLDKELASLREQCKTRKDPYFLALVGLSHLARKQTHQGVALMQQVRNFQKEAGLVGGAQAGITGSGGPDLDVETTALAVLGWLKADRPADFDTNLLRAVKWLGQQRRGAGSYGGPQATVLALKAMVAYQQKNPRAIRGGDVLISLSQVQSKEGQAGPFPSFSSRSQDPITVVLPNVNALRPGKNVIQLGVTADNTLPYTLTWAYRTQKPANDPRTPVKLSAKFNQAEAKQGEMVKLTTILENVSGIGQRMAVAIVGLPAGVSVPKESAKGKTLAALQATGKISAWELRGRELVLYWRDLARDARIEIELDLLCRSPGVFRGPASRAYLSYDADHKFWTEPLNMRIIHAP